MSNRPSDGSAPIWGGPTLLSITRVTLNGNWQTLAALLAAGVTTPQVNPLALTPSPYTAPYIDEQLKSLRVTDVSGSTALAVSIGSPLQSSVGSYDSAHFPFGLTTEIPMNLSVANVLSLKGTNNHTIDIWQFG